MSSNNPPFTPFCTKVRGTVDISSPTLHVLILPAEVILSPKGAFGHTHSSVTGRLRPRRPLPPRPKPSSCRWAPSVEPMVRPPAGFGPGDRCAENDAVFFPKGAFGRTIGSAASGLRSMRPLRQDRRRLPTNGRLRPNLWFGRQRASAQATALKNLTRVCEAGSGGLSSNSSPSQFGTSLQGAEAATQTERSPGPASPPGHPKGRFSKGGNFI